MKKFKTDVEQKAFTSGIFCVKYYISFCIRNYKCELNFLGLQCLIKDIMDFLCGSTNYIPNMSNKTFEQICDDYFASFE